MIKKIIICILSLLMTVIVSIGCSQNSLTAEIKKKKEVCSLTNIDSFKPIYDESVIEFGQLLDDEVENIEWIILKKENDKALLLSRESVGAFFIQKENDSEYKWDNSYIREYLNEDFYNEVFNDEQKSYILDTKLSNIECGNVDTIDKVFVLSKDEIKTYIQDNIENVYSGKYCTRGSKAIDMAIHAIDDIYEEKFNELQKKADEINNRSTYAGGNYLRGATLAADKEMAIYNLQMEVSSVQKDYMNDTAKYCLDMFKKNVLVRNSNNGHNVYMVYTDGNCNFEYTGREDEMVDVRAAIWVDLSK